MIVFIKIWMRRFNKEKLFPNRKWENIYDKRGYYMDILGRRYYKKLLPKQ